MAIHENCLTREFHHATNLRLRVITTGLKGGDAGHGGSTEIELSWDGPAASISVQATPDGTECLIRAAGDAEMITLRDALSAAADFLNLANPPEHDDDVR